MTTPKEIVLMRFGDLLLKKKEKLEMVSEKNPDESGLYNVYHALIDIGSSLPALVGVLTDSSFTKESAFVKEMPIKSFHIRTYRNWNDFKDLGFDSLPDEMQSPSGIHINLPDLPMTAISETSDSRTYKFASDDMGKITLFTSRVVGNGVSHGLPFKTNFAGWSGSHNMVFIA